MENRNENNVVSSGNVEDTKREAPNQSTPQVSVDMGMQPRVLLDHSERIVERRAKLQTQSSSLLVVPRCRFGNITFSFWAKDEPLAHFPRQIRSRTSAQIEPVSGFFSRLSSRRSSSAFCSSDSSSASGVSAMLSQITSTSRIRSGTGSWRTSSSTNVSPSRSTANPFCRARSFIAPSSAHRRFEGANAWTNSNTTVAGSCS